MLQRRFTQINYLSKVTITVTVGSNDETIQIATVLFFAACNAGDLYYRNRTTPLGTW